MNNQSSQRESLQQVPKLQKIKKFFSLLRPSIFKTSLFSGKKQGDSAALNNFNDAIDLCRRLMINDISISEKELVEFISLTRESALKLPGTQVSLRCEELLIKRVCSYQFTQEFQLWECSSFQEQNNASHLIEEQIAKCESQHTLQALCFVFKWHRQFSRKFTNLLMEGSKPSHNCQASRVVAWKYLLNLMEGLAQQSQILLFLQNIVGDIFQQIKVIYTEQYQPLPEESLSCFEILEYIGCMTSFELNFPDLSNTPRSSSSKSQMQNSTYVCLREMDFCADQTISAFIKVLLFQVALKNIGTVSSERSAIILISTYAWCQHQDEDQIKIIQHLENILEKFQGSDFEKTRVSQQLRLVLSSSYMSLAARKLLLSCRSMKIFLSFTTHDSSLKLKNGHPTRRIIPARSLYSQFIETITESSVIHIALALNEDHHHEDINLSVIFHGSTNDSAGSNLQNGLETTIFHKKINSSGINRFSIIDARQGIYSVLFSNKHSIFRAKQVIYRIHLLTPENITYNPFITKILFPKIKQQEDQLNSGLLLQKELDLSNSCSNRILLHFHGKCISVYSTKLAENSQCSQSESSSFKSKQNVSLQMQYSQFHKLQTLEGFDIQTDLEATIMPLIESIVNHTENISGVPCCTANQQLKLPNLQTSSAPQIANRQTSIALFVVLEDSKPHEMILFSKEQLFYLMLQHSYPNINVFVHSEPEAQLSAFLKQHIEFHSQINSFFWLFKGDMYYSMNNKSIEKYLPNQLQLQQQSQQFGNCEPAYAQQIIPDCGLECCQKVLLLLDSQENRVIVARKPSIIMLLDRDIEDTWEYSVVPFRLEFTSSIFFNEK